MASLNVLSSGSYGNCYILSCEREKLIIELGIRWNDILKNINYDIRDVVGCIVSHKHSDHSKSIPDALSYGLSVYSCQEVKDIHSGVEVLKIGFKTRIGGFTIQPLNLKHNCECYGFIISHDEFGKMLFATDCSEFKYKINDLNHILLEANYSKEKLAENICNGVDYNSGYINHLELEDSLKAIKMNYSPVLQNVVLLHLSNSNSNAEMFKSKVANHLSFFNIYIAEKGLYLQLDKSEF